MRRTDLALDIVDGVRGLDLESDGLAGEGLDEAVISHTNQFRDS